MVFGIGLPKEGELMAERVETSAERVVNEAPEEESSYSDLSRRLSRRRSALEDEVLTPEQRAFAAAVPKSVPKGEQHSDTRKAIADEADVEAAQWKWIAVTSEGKMLETASRQVALFRSRIAAAKWAANVSPNGFTINELGVSRRPAFEREIRSERVVGDAEDELAADLQDDPMWVEFRRQSEAKRATATDAEERAAAETLKNAEAEVSILESVADESAAEAEMHELALVEMFSRCQALEASIAAHHSSLRATHHGEALRDSVRKLAELQHPAARDHAAPARTAQAAAELLYPPPAAAEGTSAPQEKNQSAVWMPHYNGDREDDDGGAPPIRSSNKQRSSSGSSSASWSSRQSEDDDDEDARRRRRQRYEQQQPQPSSSTKSNGWSNMRNNETSSPSKVPAVETEEVWRPQATTRRPTPASARESLMPPPPTSRVDALMRAAERRRAHEEATRLVLQHQHQLSANEKQQQRAPVIEQPAPAPPAPLSEETAEIAEIRGKLEAAKVRNAPKVARILDEQELTWGDVDKMFRLNGADGLHRMLTTVPGLTAGAIAAIEVYVQQEANLAATAATTAGDDDDGSASPH